MTCGKLRAGFWVGLAIGVGGVACASQPVSLRPGARSFTAADYEDVYKSWTRDADDFAFRKLANVLNVTATFQSWELRWAYVVRYASDHGLGTQERAGMLRASLADAEKHHRFFVTLASSRFREADLASEHSAWRVALVDELGAQTVPIEIEPVERPGASVRAYFPTVSPFRHAFRVTFPAQRADGSPTIRPDAPYVSLRFTGPLGTVDLRWDFKSGPRAAEMSRRTRPRSRRRGT